MTTPISKRTLWLMLGISILIALSFFTRHLVGLALLGSQYNALVYNAASIRDIPPAKYDFKPDDVEWDETREYARFTREILRGEWLGATPDSFNPYLAEGVFPIQGWYRDRLGPILLAILALPFSSNVPLAFLLADLILPWLVAFFLLVLCWEIRPNLKFSILATSLVMWFNWQDLVEFFQFLGGAPQNAALWLRTPYPQLSSLFVILFFIALIRFHRRPTLLYAGVVGLGLLATFYTYFYAWSFTFVIVGLYLSLLVFPVTAKLVQVNAPQTHLKKLLPVIVLMVGLAFPVWGVLVHSSPEFQDSFVRVFGVFSHSPDWRGTLLLLPMLLLTLAVNTTRWQTRWLWLLFWTSALVLLNQQVITGKVNQPGHWTELLFEPIALVFFCDLGVVLYRAARACFSRLQLQSRLVGALVAILFIAGLGQNVYKLWQGAVAALPYNDIDSSLRSLIVFLQAPEFARDGFLTNDAYLDIVLPGQLPQKPLNPWYMDPLTDEQIRTLRTASTVQFGDILGTSLNDTSSTQTPIRFKLGLVLLILNRHRELSPAAAHCVPLFENVDYLVIQPQGCPR